MTKPKSLYYVHTMASPADLAQQLQLADCPDCGAAVNFPCIARDGKAVSPHSARPYREPLIAD